jgi:hypothetical protein
MPRRDARNKGVAGAGCATASSRPKEALDAGTADGTAFRDPSEATYSDR